MLTWRTDQRDMRRLGKKQELKVSRAVTYVMSAFVLTHSASIPILLGRGLRCRPWSHMGVLTHYTRLQSRKWWYCRRNLAGTGGLLLHVLRHVVYG